MVESVLNSYSILLRCKAQAQSGAIKKLTRTRREMSKSSSRRAQGDGLALPREAPKTRDTLTPRQARFVAEYLIDINATQAAIRAGYSKKTAKQQGAHQLTKVDGAAAVAKGAARTLGKLK